MVSAAFSLFFLHELGFERYAFPRWQSVLAVTVIGLLTGWDSGAWSEPEMPVIPRGVSLALETLAMWVAFLVSVGFLRWWLKRDGRWDGRGDLFNLVAASWLVTDALCIGLESLGVSFPLIVPLWLYSIWVAGNALSGAVPKVSLGYAIGGVVISLIPAILLIGLLFAVFGFVLTLLA